MAIYTDSKEGLGAQVPDGAVETAWDDTEPLITPSKVRRLHLFGIPLVSGIKNPLTGKADIIDDALIADLVTEAVTLVEAETGLELFPRQHKERHPYDQKAADSFGFAVLRHRPVRSVEQLAIVSSDGSVVWDVPLAWLETGNLHQGQINMLPFAVATAAGVAIPQTGPVAMGLLPSLFRFNWVPALWTATYTTGFKAGALPRVLNHLVGVVTAMELLAMLAATYARTSSSSLGIDGLSTSVSTPGGDLFTPRLTELGEKRKWMVAKIKRLFNLGFFVDNV